MTDDDRAEAIMSVLDRAGTLAPFSGADRDFDLAAGYRTAARLAARRVAAGGRPVGRKIGFTNTAIWDEYGVHAPIWGPVWDSTVRLSGPEPFALASLSEPRIEPEIVLRLASTPEPGMDATALAGCVEAVALGFEVVQSPYPDWRFAAADAVAAAALHGGLVTGPFAETGDPLRWASRLSGFSVTLHCDRRIADRGGSAALVGGGPLGALDALAALLASDPDAPPLRPGEIVATGTLTRALPVQPGQTWTATVAGLPLRPLTLRFS